MTSQHAAVTKDRRQLQVTRDTIDLETAQWDRIRLCEDDLALLSEFTGLSIEQCIERNPLKHDGR